MGEHYLRVEGVNLRNFLEDTQDLSTIRGGSLLLLHAVNELGRQTFCGVTLKPVSTGASVGLYAFDMEGAGGATAEDVVNEVLEWLNNHTALRHASFVVDTVPARGDAVFREDLETLIAKNRWQQMRAPTVAVPGGKAEGPCYLDRVRPAPTPGTGNKLGGKWISESVAQRRDYGIGQKQNFYEGILGGRSVSTLFAWDFEHIGSESERRRGPLANKIAVIYVDGNEFGKHQQDLCTTPEWQTQFDAQLKEKRQEFLKSFLDSCVIPDQDAFLHWEQKQDYYRMETLLWGGDEFLLVVPAWRGWEALQFFFQAAAGWDVTIGEGEEAVTRPLTHAAGLVFCNMKSPIHRATALAHRLCESAKRDRARSLFAYQALESFDALPDNVEAYRASGLCGAPAEALLLEGTRMGEVAKGLAELKDAEFPRRKLFDLARGRLRGEDESAFLAGLPPEAQTAAERLISPLNGAARWHHVAELWDYAGKGGETRWLL